MHVITMPDKLGSESYCNQGLHCTLGHIATETGFEPDVEKEDYYPGWAGVKKHLARLGIDEDWQNRIADNNDTVADDERHNVLLGVVRMVDGLVMEDEVEPDQTD